MSSGPKPMPSLLRLVRGDSHPERARDEKPKIAAVPVVPPGVVLDVAEQLMFDWLIAHVYQAGVHGTGDGAAFVKVARLWARVNLIDEQLRQSAQLITEGKVSALARLSRDLWQQLGPALAEIGASPTGRVRLAPRGAADDKDVWGAID
jgi:hypothetical protein